MEFELSRWGDKSVRLVYWDHRHGNDIVIRLNTDGTAHLIDYNLQDEEVPTEIDLISFLIEEALREEEAD